MAKYGFDDIGFFLVDGYSLLGVHTEFNVRKEAITEETHGDGDSWAEHSFVGHRRAELTQQGFFDDAAGSINAALVSGTGTERVLCLGLETNVLSKKFIGFAGAMQIAYERAVTRGELHKANATYQGSGAVEEGVILHVHQVETGATLNSTSNDNAASSAAGASGYLEVSALTLGTQTNFAPVIQHSTDNAAWADVITFAVVTAAPNAQRVTAAGTINRYTRNTHTYNGGGSGQSVTYMTGIARG